MSEKYKLLIELKCPKCGKDYGKTNLLYQNCEIWVSCDCDRSDKAIFINTDNLVIDLNQPDCKIIPLREIN